MADVAMDADASAAAKPSDAAADASAAAKPIDAAATSSAPQAVAPVFSLAPPADDSSDDAADEDGLPSMSGGFGYWSQMLNVTKTADPLPPPPSGAPAGQERSGGKSKSRGSSTFNAFGGGGSGGKGDRRGGKGKGKWKGKSRVPLNTNSVGDFMSWAKDPDASDGRRSRSRSPRRTEGKERLENFMSWAKEEDEIKASKEEPEDSSGAGMGDFLAWASAAQYLERGDSVKPERELAVKKEETKERGADALAEKEERRLAGGDGSDDDHMEDSKHLCKAEVVDPTALPPPKAELGDAAEAKKEESDDDDIDLAAMQRFRRLDAELSDDENAT